MKNSEARTTVTGKLKKLKRQPNHWARFAALLFLLMAISGFLRAYGAIDQKDILLEFGLSKSKYLYLMIAGLFYGSINLIALGFVLSRKPARLVIAWGIAIISIALYWFERLFLWAPEQRGGNWLWMLLMHLGLLIVLLLFGRTERIRAKR